MAESISPERMQRLMELSNNAMTVELGALRNPQVTTVPLSEPEAFYKTTPNVERFRNNMLRRQYKIIQDNNARLQFEKRYADSVPLSEHEKREINLEIIDAQKEIEKIKNYTEEAVAAHVKGLQLETVADIEGDFSLSGLDQARDQLVLSDSAEDTVLAHELGHGAFSEAKDFFLRKIKELGSITAAEEAVSLEYGEAISRAIAKDLRNTKTLGFPDTNEGIVQYYDNPQGDDPLNPGVGTPTFKGGATYYSPDGGFQGMDADFPKTTDPLLQKPFTDYRTGELVYHDEYKGDFEGDLKEAGLMGFETLMSDLISEKKGLDRFAERQRRGLKINPLGAPKGEVLRSVRPQTRPENFAQGGPVMRGIGTLNETARNMTRGPRGIGAYQQFSYGGPVRGDRFNGLGTPINMPYGPEQQLAYQQPPFVMGGMQQPQFGMGGMQQGNGINQYGQYLERTYGDPEFDQKRDTFLQEVQQKERQTFGGGGGSFGFPAMLSNEGYGLDPRDRFFGLEKAQIAEGVRSDEMQLFASGGEAMGPPPTRGPDPQGIGAYQQFADGGPVYMNNGGDPTMRQKLLSVIYDVESDGDYDQWNYAAKNIPETPITDMTVEQIMRYQGDENGPAAGAGQIKFNTFKTLLKMDDGLLPTDVFTPEVQDHANNRLLDRRGFNAWSRGEKSSFDFANDLASEWAGLPLVRDTMKTTGEVRKAGESRYGNNTPGISANNWLSAVTAAFGDEVPDQIGPAAPVYKSTPVFPNSSEGDLDLAMYAEDYGMPTPTGFTPTLRPKLRPNPNEPQPAINLSEGIGNTSVGQRLMENREPVQTVLEAEAVESREPRSMYEAYSMPEMEQGLLGNIRSYFN